MSIEKTANYYDTHWQNFADLDYPQVKLDKVKNFFSPVISEITEGKKLLDVGCGDGVHWQYLKRIAEKPVNYRGVDISENAITILTEHFASPDDQFSVMDACDLKFPDETFDLVFSYGVIGYTDDPFPALAEMVRVCRRNGWVGLFSPEIGGISKTILETVRGISTKLGPKGKKALADLMVPFFGFAPSETQISLRNASWKQVREVIMTDIAPPKLDILTHEEIEGWYKNLNVAIRFEDAEQRTTVWGKKL